MMAPLGFLALAFSRSMAPLDGLALTCSRRALPSGHERAMNLKAGHRGRPSRFARSAGVAVEAILTLELPSMRRHATSLYAGALAAGSFSRNWVLCPFKSHSVSTRQGAINGNDSLAQSFLPGFGGSARAVRLRLTTRMCTGIRAWVQMGKAIGAPAATGS